MTTTFERIKATAKAKHMTLAELNDRANLGNRTIYNWKKVDPSITALTKVANVLGVTTDYLLGTESHANEPKDIQEILTDVTNGLSSQDGLYFMKNGGQNLSPEEAEMLRSSLENTIRLSKYLAEQRRNDDEDPKM